FLTIPGITTRSVAMLPTSKPLSPCPLVSTFVRLFTLPVQQARMHDASRRGLDVIPHKVALAADVASPGVKPAAMLVAGECLAPVTCEVGPRCSVPPMPLRCCRDGPRPAGSRGPDTRVALFR